MAGGVFISYRREDSAGFAGRIYDRLVSRLESSRVFFDVDNIEPGLDFVKVLADRVGDCDALVAIIGEEWLAVRDEEDRRRLDDPHDFVRIEIEAALQRDIRVIPVLINGARMPRALDLPDALKGLARRQAIEISHTRFDTDSERLTRALQRALDAPRAPPPEPESKNPADAHEAHVPSVAPPVQAPPAAAEPHPPAPPPPPLVASNPEPQASVIDEGRRVKEQPAASPAKAVAKPFPIKALAAAAVVAIAILGFVYLRMTANHEPPLKPVFVTGQLTASEASDFSGPEGGPFDPPQAILNLKASGAGFDWAIDNALPAWLTATPIKGHLPDDGNADVTLTLTPGAALLGPGRHEGQIIFKNLTSGLTVARTESLTVAARPPPVDELKGVMRPPLPVTFGDTYEKVKAAYKTAQEPEPFISSITKKQDGTMLQLKQLGIWFFFDASGKITTIRFDAPFAGTVSGVRIGDTRSTVERILGKPEPSDDTTSVSYPKYPHELWYDLLNNTVITIFL